VRRSAAVTTGSSTPIRVTARYKAARTPHATRRYGCAANTGDVA
jgi:hypothetical protein